MLYIFVSMWICVCLRCTSATIDFCIHEYSYISCIIFRNSVYLWNHNFHLEKFGYIMIVIQEHIKKKYCQYFYMSEKFTCSYYILGCSFCIFELYISIIIENPFLIQVLLQDRPIDILCQSIWISFLVMLFPTLLMILWYFFTLLFIPHYLQHYEY